jgi:aminoglycoside phosphotransferase (APT) family kinase protein
VARLDDAEAGRRVQLGDLRRLGGGREAEIFAFGQGRVLRLARDPTRGAAVDREVAALSAARQAGAPVPAVYERREVDGRPGAAMERLDGKDLLSRIGGQPWSVWAVGRTLGTAHAQLHQVHAPKQLPAVADDLAARLQSDLVPPAIRSSALATLGDLPGGEQLCHGDFHPGNLLAKGSGYAVIDWSRGARGHPAADVARTQLLIAHGDVPGDAPRAVRWLHQSGRRILLAGYLSAYRKLQSLDPALVAAWGRVTAAARLADDISSERETMLAAAR